MSSYTTIRRQLIKELWEPALVDLSNIIDSHHRKNKKLMILSLSDASDNSFADVQCFLKNKLSTKNNIRLWSGDYVKKQRLESSGCEVVFKGRYERGIESAEDIFPFDIINLDYPSQELERYEKRIEQELSGVNTTLDFQIRRDKKSFIIIYTTLLDEAPINLISIINKLNIPKPPDITDAKPKQLDTILCQLIEGKSLKILDKKYMNLDSIFSIILGIKGYA